MDMTRYAEGRFLNVAMFKTVICNGDRRMAEGGVIVEVESVYEERMRNPKTHQHEMKMVVKLVSIEKPVIAGSVSSASSFIEAVGTTDADTAKGRSVVLYLDGSIGERGGLRWRECPSQNLGPKRSAQIRAGFQNTGIEMAKVIAWAKVNDTRLHDAIFDKEMSDWPVWSEDGLRRAYKAMTEGA